MAAQHSSQTNVNRRTADFHPSLWGNYFLQYASESSENEVTTEEQVQYLKEEVKKMLAATTTPTDTEVSQTLELVDKIQRLGFSYHFEEEISEILRQIKKIGVDHEAQDYDLHSISLWFRLLRQEGYNISSDIFTKFTYQEGKFKDELGSEVQGMLSLYEAAHFMVHNEPLLEEALSFATVRLQSLIISPSSNLSPFLAHQVKHALEQPVMKGLPRVEARHFISIYHLEPSHNEVLLKFAKLDFNIVQEMHKKELGYNTRWWKNLDIKSKLPYARDRQVEIYFWAMGVYFEPKYAQGRSIMFKVISLVSIFDDTYDLHGTIEELQALTNAVHRWNINCVDELPNYMKHIFRTVLDTYNEIEEALIVNESRGLYRIQYAVDSMKKLVQSYFDEAKCYHKNYVPTTEEYMQMATVSSSVWTLTITSFLGMGDIATEEALEWASKFPKIMYGASVIGRLLNDIVGHEFEQQRGVVASGIECYMKQHGASKKEAYIEMYKLVAEAWKDINEEFLEPRAAPMPLLARALNIARTCHVMYKEEDIYTRAQGLMKDLIKDLFVDPIPM